jgi:hypothetical protein
MRARRGRDPVGLLAQQVHRLRVAGTRWDKFAWVSLLWVVWCWCDVVVRSVKSGKTLSARSYKRVECIEMWQHRALVN